MTGLRTAQRPFGYAVLGEWHLDPGTTYLNHGTVGVTPKVVLEAQDRIRQEIETNPSLVLLRGIGGMLGPYGPGRLRQAAGRVAEFVGAREDDVVFVANATEGVNAVLGSIELGPDDGVLVTETTYGGVSRAARYACRRSGAELQTATLPFPVPGREAVLAAIDAAIEPSTRLAILDHIVSETGVVLPVTELADLCHRRGVRVLIDGAHAPGQLDLDVPSIGADWYVANLHKWAMAPRSCGILWASPEAQVDLHPTVISWGLDEGFTREFDWTGTRDLSPCLAAPAGLEFLRQLGFDRLARHNRNLVLRGSRMLQERWGALAGGPEEMTAFMATVSLPPSWSATTEVADRLRDVLLFEHRIEVPIMAIGERLWARLSIQVYNELDDFVRFAEAVEAEAPR